MDTVARLSGLIKRFGAVTAVDGVGAVIPAGRVTGLVGADGAGKTTLLRLMAGLLRPDAGTLEASADIGYMPQRFGLYEDLTVAENLRLYADLRGLAASEQPAAFARLLDFSGLDGFQGRLAGKLSGGMKQKLGLACALLATPRLLLLDEPSVGVDPVSRRQLWRMVHELADQGVGVVWSTAYLDEAERCHGVLLLDNGKLLHDGPPSELTDRVAGRCFVVRGAPDRRAAQQMLAARPGIADCLIQGATIRLVMEEGRQPPADTGLEVAPTPPRFEDAFITLLDRDHTVPTLPARSAAVSQGDTVAVAQGDIVAVAQGDIVAVRARDLVRRFGDFVAVDHVSFEVRAGEIFGLLGPNGAGKSTTFRMLCGLLPASSGLAEVGGLDLSRAAAQGRQRLGYMSQKFSLYPDLSVVQNLRFFAGIYGLAGAKRRLAIDGMLDVFALAPFARANAGTLPLGFKQRLALACAIMHEPDTLFLDEPTSGVDPLVRREFWTHINAMAAQGVSVLVTTHFLDEAEYCDRLGIVHGGRLIALDSPERIKAATATPDRPDPSLEDAFVALVEARPPTAARRVAS